VPPATYQASLQLLEVAIRYARARGIKLIFVLAPIRPIKPNPMLPADIARYRRDVIGLCEKYGVECLDYVDLVPERLWTNYMVDNPNVGQRDYAHFTGAAHRLLAQRLWQDAGAKISAWLQ
jgi:lysophospholipase L1-like esterase